MQTEAPMEKPLSVKIFIVIEWLCLFLCLLGLTFIIAAPALTGLSGTLGEIVQGFAKGQGFEDIHQLAREHWYILGQALSVLVPPAACAIAALLGVRSRRLWLSRSAVLLQLLLILVQKVMSLENVHWIIALLAVLLTSRGWVIVLLAVLLTFRRSFKSYFHPPTTSESAPEPTPLENSMSALERICAHAWRVAVLVLALLALTAFVGAISDALMRLAGAPSTLKNLFLGVLFFGYAILLAWIGWRQHWKLFPSSTKRNYTPASHTDTHPEKSMANTGAKK